MDSDKRPNVPVAEFEGDFVRSFEAKLPGITLDMPEGYLRGTHLVLSVEARVRGAGYDEDKKHDLVRRHLLTLEEVRLVDAFDPASRPSKVGGNLASGSWVDVLADFLEEKTDELDFEGEEIPDRLREILKVYAEYQNQTPGQTDHSRDEEVGF